MLRKTFKPLQRTTIKMNAHKVIAVSFSEPKPMSFEFTKWPNHITIVPYFKSTNPKKLSDDIKKVCIGINQIPYQVGSVDYFGVNKDVKVSRVKLTDALLKLHSAIQNVVLNHDKNFDTKFSCQNYKPHITHGNEPYPRKNDKGCIKTVYLVEDLCLATKEKEIIAAINLS